MLARRDQIVVSTCVLWITSLAGWKSSPPTMPQCSLRLLLFKLDGDVAALLLWFVLPCSRGSGELSV